MRSERTASGFILIARLEPLNSLKGAAFQSVHFIFLISPGQVAPGNLTRKALTELVLWNPLLQAGFNGAYTQPCRRQ